MGEQELDALGAAFETASRQVKALVRGDDDLQEAADAVRRANGLWSEHLGEAGTGP